MNKKCKACGSNVPEQARFCQKCGGSEFIVSNQQAVNYDPNVNQMYQMPVPQNQPKKKNTGMIVGIVVAVLFGLAALGTFAEKALQNRSRSDGNASSTNYSATGEVSGISSEEISMEEEIVNEETIIEETVTEESVKVEYTKGTFDGTVYENPWADIRLVLPEGFSDADASIYAASENATTDCGAYFISDNTPSLIYISFEKLPAFPIYSEEDYLDVALETLENSSQLEYKITDTYYTAMIGGYSYTKAEGEFNNGYGDFAHTFYVRKLDNYMIIVSVMGINAESNEALVGTITNIN